MSIQHDNLYYPVMYLMKQFTKRYMNGEGQNVLPKEVVEPIKLHRDDRGRLEHVEGWEYLDVNLTYNTRGVLEFVDVKHRLTGKHMKITLIYNDRLLLEEVIPEIIDSGLGEPGEINIPDVIQDY